MRRQDDTSPTASSRSMSEVTCAKFVFIFLSTTHTQARTHLFLSPDVNTGMYIFYVNVYKGQYFCPLYLYMFMFFVSRPTSGPWAVRNPH